MSDNNKLPVGVNPNFKYAIAKIECVYIGKFVEYQKTHSSPIRNGHIVTGKQIGRAHV